jgi:hypothetical protein
MTNIIFYVDKDNEDNNNEQLCEIRKTLQKRKIEYTTVLIKNTIFIKKRLLSDAVTKMRMMQKTGTFNELAILPIIEAEKEAWNGNEIDKACVSNTPKRQIKHKIRITKKPTKRIDMTPETMARVNVTMIRLVEGVSDINEIMTTWTEQEKAAGLIMWKLAQYNNAKILMLLREMIYDKVIALHPNMESNDWIGNME